MNELLLMLVSLFLWLPFAYEFGPEMGSMLKSRNPSFYDYFHEMKHTLSPSV